VKRLLSLVLMLATALSLSACNDIGTGPAGSLTGTYTLRTLGGQQLPATLFYTSASDHVEIVSSQITLNTNGTYDDATRIQDTEFGRTQVYDERTEGTWQLSGSELTLRDRYDFSNVSYAYVTNNRLVIDRFAGSNASAEYVR
jgi:hypothetical protein